MDARAIKRLRLKFILISTVTYFLVMIFMGLFINASNILLSRQQIHTVLSYMLKEEMNSDPKEKEDGKDEQDERENTEHHENMLNQFSAEFHYSARYFSAILDKNGSPTEIKTAHIMALTREEASAMAVKAFSKKRRFGRDGDYYYEKAVDENEYTHIIFLN